MATVKMKPTTSAANYGQTTNYGTNSDGTPNGTGAYGASREGHDQATHNDKSQALSRIGASYASDQANDPTDVGQGVQDAGLANNQASGANGNQAGAIELARRLAMGEGISQGAMQLQSGLNQASAQQTAYAAGARGGASLATASANAAANRSNLQQNAFTGAGMLKSQEMAQGRGMYAGMLNDKRAGDSAALGESNRIGIENNRMKDGYQLGMGQGAVGFGQVANGQDAQDLNNWNRGMNPIYAQDDMNQQRNGWQFEDSRDAEATNKANTNQKNYGVAD